MQWPERNLSDDASRLLLELKERKQRWDKLKGTQPLFAILTGGLILYVIFSFYRKVIVVSGGSALAMLDLVVSNRFLSASLLICISLFVYTTNRVGQIERAKSKYENLRIETIEKLGASWLKDVNSESRDSISRFLHNEYDINIVYKS